MNQMTFILEDRTSRAGSYETIQLESLEDLMMNYLYSIPGGKDYTTPLKFWKGTIKSSNG
jgi:hypothetical protein